MLVVVVALNWCVHDVKLFRSGFVLLDSFSVIISKTHLGMLVSVRIRFCIHRLMLVMVSKTLVFSCLMGLVMGFVFYLSHSL